MSFKIVTDDPMCISCEFKDVKINPLYSNNRILEMVIHCEHEEACQRAYEFAKGETETNATT